jgi:tetratricopeptide (TPR) repeat protein
MSTRRTLTAVALLFALSGTVGLTQGPGADVTTGTPLAPVLKNLGTLHYKVTTRSERAQAFFDQGLRLMYGFNHAEAIRAFQESARLDPTCGMAFWGEAYATGPNINDPLPTPDRTAAAYAAMQKAIKAKQGLTATEQALIDAMARRFSSETIEDWTAPNAEYTEAMDAVQARFPNDSEVNVLFVASVLETRPWDYWKKGDAPHPGIAKALSTLEKVMKDYPDHPGANHYYIHMVEATSTPERAVPSADKLESLMPGAGHMVHMPAHIYMRVGRYADAASSNERAILADEDYISQCQAQGMYPASYYPHNIHFLWSAATMEGRSEAAIDAARKVGAKTSHDMSHEFTPVQDFLATPYFALVRFGHWEEMLTEAAPAKDLAFLNAMWHYGRAAAFVARGQYDHARAELKALDSYKSDPSLGLEVGGTSGTTLQSLVDLSSRIVSGELAAKEKRFDEAIKSLESALAMQDAQRYFEPPAWHYPVRQALGAVLLDAGRANDAEVVYREDLRRNPENGWSLFGLKKSLEAQKKTDEAAAVEARFRRAWSRADVTLTASRIM